MDMGGKKPLGESRIRSQVSRSALPRGGHLTTWQLKRSVINDDNDDGIDDDADDDDDDIEDCR